MTIGSTLATNRETQKSNGLLFQFILSEFLESYEEIRKLGALNGCKEALPSRTDAEHVLMPLQEALLKLLGSSKAGIRCFSWSFADGLLNKLHSYSLMLLENSEQFEKELLAMHYYIEKSRVACFSLLDLVKKRTRVRAELHAAVEKAIAAMQRLSKLIAGMMQQFREDENVIFFILRHKLQFDTLFGTRFVTKTLSRMYPRGLHEMRQLLLKKYTGRGFENLLHRIHSLISELES